MAVVINELDVLVEPPSDPGTGPPRAVADVPAGMTTQDLDEVARHLEARRARVRAD